ncbi:hypothetical protein J3Q64DRAFT_1335425 [Phycomyces blakesleeanus]|uniref:Secreted protein n=1 Tax=Phycomyces blakesleeanus TaxID=4837 RepID=A0ABR3B7B3_PHYBL
MSLTSIYLSIYLFCTNKALANKDTLNKMTRFIVIHTYTYTYTYTYKFLISHVITLPDPLFFLSMNLSFLNPLASCRQVFRKKEKKK